jgi:hypothetical protein
MPIAVYIPIRIRVEPQTVTERSGDLEEALSAALRRALAHSRKVVLDQRGGYITTVLNRPQVAWCGNGWDRVSDSERNRLEDCIARLCADLCASEGIAEWGRRKRTTAANDFTGISEPFDTSRWDPALATYSIPFYDKHGKHKPVPLAKSEPHITKTVELATFQNSQDVYIALQSFYKKDIAPKGNQFTGVYGIWGPAGKPHLIWVTGIVEEGPLRGNPIFDSISLTHGRIENKRFVGNPVQPMSVTLGGRYYLMGLTNPKRSQDVEYRAELRETLHGKAKPAFITDQRIAGKVIRFGVPKVAAIVTTVAAPATPPPEPPVSPLPTRPWLDFEGWNSVLPAVPQDGEPAWLWWWFVWFNVRPAEVRALMPLRKVFMDLEKAGARDKAIELSWLWELRQWQTLIYRRYCRHLALELLDTSRKNMAEFKKTIQGGGFKDRLAAELAVLKQPAEELTEVASLPALESELSAQEHGAYMELATITEPNEVAAAAVRVRVAHAKLFLANAKDNQTILQLFQEMDPLLAIFTVASDRILGGYKTVSLASGIAAAAAQTPDELVKIMDANLDWMLKKTLEAINEITNDRDVASKLQVVQKIANEQLKPWFAEVSSMQDAMELVTKTSWVDWILLGGALLVLTFAFPPAGIALGAAVTVGTAIQSTLQAMQLSRLGKARLAQFGFEPLVSEEEIQAAWLEAAVNIAFAVSEIGGMVKGLVGAAARAVERAAAREAVGAVGQQIERILAAWNNFEKWPQALRNQLRERIAVQLEKRGITTAAQVDAGLQSLQREMLYRYEQDLLRFQRKFGEAIANKAVSPRDIEAMRKWFHSEFTNPTTFLEELSGEFQPGKSLFDDTLGRQLASLPPIERTAVDFFGGLAGKELKDFMAALSNPKLLTPNRLSALAREAGLPVTYRELAERLDSILLRVENPERALAMIEDLLSNRRDARAILQGLGNSTNPSRALEAMLTPKVLDAPMAGGIDELFEAFAAPAKSSRARVSRIVADVDEKGVIKLYREVTPFDYYSGSGGVRELPEWARIRRVERWEGKARGWVPDPQTRIAVVAPERTVAEVSAEAEATAVDELAQLAAESRASGRLTGAAGRARNLLDKIQVHPVRSEIAKVIAREGRETGARLVDNLAYLLEDGVKGKELDGLADFLRRGGTGAEAADILHRGAKEGGKIFRDRIRSFLEKVPRLREPDFAGITLVLRSRRTPLEGAEAILDIARNFPEMEFAFGALANLAPHSDGMGALIAYLTHFSEQNLPKAASAHLKAAQELLAEFPGCRLVFEAKAEGFREIDVRVVTQYSRTQVLDVEIKEHSQTFFLKNSEVRKQFAKDIERSVRTAKPGERALGRMRWLVREKEIVATYMTKNAIADVTKGREGVLKQLQDIFEKAFERDELNTLTEAQFQAAWKDFNEHFNEIVKLF